MTLDFLPILVLLLGTSVLTISGIRWLGLPPLLAYLFIGIVLGPHALGILTGEGALPFLAEIGLVFLLFMLGLEFSLPQLFAMRGPALKLGGSQVLISTLSGTIIVYMTGLGWQTALVVGSAMAFSSTAIGVRQLSEQQESRKQHGRLVISILLFQDLAAVPLLAIIPILAQNQDQSLLVPLLIVLSKGVLAILLVFFCGHFLLRPLFHLVSKTQSAELLTLTTLFAALLAAWSSHAMGLSLELGAFLAGVMLGETEYRRQIESDLRPFRDLLMGLFFIQVGMYLNLAVLSDYKWSICLLVPGLILGKGMVVMLLTRWTGHTPAVSLRTGLILGQGSEFGFAVLILALSSGLITPYDSQPVLCAIILSMLISPLLIRHNEKIVRFFFPRSEQSTLSADPGRPPDPKGHVILCGFGHVGQSLASFLQQAGKPYTALEIDPVLVRACRTAGENTFYGDCTSLELLKAAGVLNAIALVVTFDKPAASEKIVQQLRKVRPTLPIIVRISDDSYFDRLDKAGATDIVPEHVEAGTTLATHLLDHLGMPSEQLLKLVEKTRYDQYTELRGYFRGSMDTVSAKQAVDKQLRAVLLSDNSHAIGCQIGELLEQKKGEEARVRIHSVRRGAVRNEAPDPHMVLQTGDTLIIQGNYLALEQAEKWLLWG